MLPRGLSMLGGETSLTESSTKLPLSSKFIDPEALPAEYSACFLGGLGVFGEVSGVDDVVVELFGVPKHEVAR